MPSFKLPLTVAVAGVLCSGGALAQDQQNSMFKDAPSIADSPIESLMKKSEGGGLHIKRHVDGSVTLDGKMHGGGGVRTNIVIPKINYDVRIDGPAGLDENGRPTTWSRKIDKAMGHAIVFKGLKAQGYKYEEHRKKRESEGLFTQLDQWKAKNEETKAYIEKHGAITTKAFIVPGSTPEQSAVLSDPEVGVRKENGKLVYYYQGKRIDLNRPAKTAGSKAHPITRQKTKVSVSSKQKGTAPAVPAVQRTPPGKQYLVPPEENLRRDPTDAFMDPAALPTVRSLESIFGRPKAGLGEEEGTKSDGDVQGQLRDENGRKAKKAQKAHVDPGNNSRTTGFLRFGERILGNALGVGRAMAGVLDDHNLNVPAPQLSEEEGRKLKGIIAEIKGANERLVEKLKARNSSVQRSPGTTDVEGAPYLQAASEGDFDSAEFAADVVNRSQKSLTPGQFEDDIRAVLGSISASDSPANVVNALADMLESNPEIYAAIPDADIKLQQLSGKLIDDNPLDSKGEATYIFVSYSLSENVLEDIVKQHKGRDDVTLVMRGVPQGMNIPEGIRKMQAIANSVEPIASVIIDPALFREYGIKQVPAVVRVGRSPSALALSPDMRPGRKFAPLIAKVSGLHNDKWLMERIEAGEKGDMGVQGSLSEIEEPDLIEEMKKRVALIDWEQKKEEAVKRFWKGQTFDVLPTADLQRVREIDPTILVEKDLKDLAGNCIRKAGDRVNPLQIRPFTQTLLIFNPVSEEEMFRVETFLSERSQRGLAAPVMIATQIDKAKDWDGYKELTDRLDAHVFLLTPEVKHRWRIEKTPSVVTADNRRHVFLVQELGPIEAENQKGTKNADR